MRTMLVILTLALAACGRSSQPPVIDAAFQPAVDEFLAAAAARGVDVDMRGISIAFGKTNSTSVAVCNHWDGSIVVVEPYWKAVMTSENPELATALIAHELGHCALGRGHVDTKLDDRPTSIMYPNVSALRLHFEEFSDEYFDELFKEER